MATKGVYVILNEYQSRDYQGTDVCGVYFDYDREEAIKKAKELAEDTIKNAPYEEDEIYYEEDNDSGVFEITYFDDSYSIFKVVPSRIEL